MHFVSFLFVSGPFLRSQPRIFLSHEIYCPDASLPHPKSLFPVITEVFPPYIIHMKAEKGYRSLLDFILDESPQLRREYIRELLDFGAVYVATAPVSSSYASTSSSPPSTLKAERVTPSFLQKNVPILPSTYCRVHVNPRRYPAASLYGSTAHCRTMVLEDTTDYLVISKPVGSIPVSSTVDNARENIIELLKVHLQIPELYAVGRLDACTSGTLILAKTNSAASKINSLLRSRAIQKRYVALCMGPRAPPTGLIQHLFRKKNKKHPSGKPSLLRAYCKEVEEGEWQLAELIIQSSRRVAVKMNKDFHDAMNGLANEYGNEKDSNDLNEGKSRFLWEVEIELLTGRTHQIRLQLSALGNPIVLDSRYVPVAGMLEKGECESKTNREKEKKALKPSGAIEEEEFSDLFGQEPKTSIGLHCVSLNFPSGISPESNGDLSNEAKMFVAHPPWWRQNMDVE